MKILFENSGASQSAILDLVKDYLKFDASETDKKNSEELLNDPDKYFDFKEVQDGIEIERK